MTYQYQWVPMLQNAEGWYEKGVFGNSSLPGRGDEWLKAIREYTPALLKRREELGFTFVNGQRPGPNAQGRIATTLEWAKRLNSQDIDVLRGLVPFSERVPDVDAGFTARDFKIPARAQVATRVIQGRLDRYNKLRPGGFLVREAPAEDVRLLQLLLGHL